MCVHMYVLSHQGEYVPSSYQLSLGETAHPIVPLPFFYIFCSFSDLLLKNKNKNKKNLFFLFKKIFIAFHLLLQTFCSCWNLPCLVYAEIFHLIHGGKQLGQLIPGLCREWTSIIQIPGT